MSVLQPSAQPGMYFSVLTWSRSRMLLNVVTMATLSRMLGLCFILTEECRSWGSSFDVQQSLPQSNYLSNFAFARTVATTNLYEPLPWCQRNQQIYLWQRKTFHSNEQPRWKNCWCFCTIRQIKTCGHVLTEFRPRWTWMNLRTSYKK